MSGLASGSSRFFTSAASLGKRFDLVARRMGFSAESVEEAVGWQGEVRAHLEGLVGLRKHVPVDPSPRVEPLGEADGYRMERLEIYTEPDVCMPVIVLIPAGMAPGERRPVVVAPHGHGSGGKLAVAGITDRDDMSETVAKHNYDYGVQFVKEGFMVFCPDARGFGERRELPFQRDDQLLQSSCQFLNHMAIPLGQTVTGMWTWDLMRLLDYIETRDDCDPERIGCAGLSGGGLQTMWLAALDGRVRCAVVSGYFYGVRESLLERAQNCSCNYVPGLWESVDMGDIGGLIAPRPLLIETGNKDPLNGRSGLANVTPQVEIARSVYGLFDADDNVVHDVFDGEHRWNGAVSIPWMKERL